MRNNKEFIEGLVDKIADLLPVYREHVFDNDELYPHVFMGDVARFVILKSQEKDCSHILKSLVDFLEIGLLEGSDEVKELIVVSFVENLIGESQALKVLGPMFGSCLAGEVEKICCPDQKSHPKKEE